MARRIERMVLFVLAVALHTGTASADLVFVSTPDTTATVDRFYSYSMQVAPATSTSEKGKDDKQGDGNDGGKDGSEGADPGQNDKDGKKGKDGKGDKDGKDDKGNKDGKGGKGGKNDDERDGGEDDDAGIQGGGSDADDESEAVVDEGRGGGDSDSIDDTPATATDGAASSKNELDGLRFVARALPPWLEFDGYNTIYGTPGPDDVGEYRVRLRARTREQQVDQEFTLRVAAGSSSPPATEADLAASITVDPNPVGVGDTVTWTVTARNFSDVDVGNIVLSITLSGDTGLVLDNVDDPACAIVSQETATSIVCRWSPLVRYAARSVRLVGEPQRAGDIVASAVVSIADALPEERKLDNNSARVVLHVAAPRLGRPVQELSARGAVAIAARDFNGDARDDLAVATAAGEPTLIFLQREDDATHPFSTVPLSVDDADAGASGIAAGDLDGDGAADLVVADALDATRVLFNDGAAGFEVVRLDERSAHSRGVAIADLDGDALADITLVSDSATVVYRNLGSRAWEAEEVDREPADAVAAADLEDDTLPEVVLLSAGGDARVYARSAGAYARKGAISTGGASAAATADFDADGDVDLAIGRDAPSRVLFNASGGSFSASDLLGESASAAVLAADFDLDGREDVVTVSALGAHRMYRNDGSQPPGFKAIEPGFTGKPAVDAAWGLFDTGGLPDVAVAGSDVVAIFLNVGNLDKTGLGIPLLRLKGAQSMTLRIGEAFVDPGATAIDDLDGDLTSRIAVDNPIDTGVIGRYSVTYEVTDSSGNFASAQRNVEVVPRAPEGGGGGGAAGLVLSLWSVLGACARVRWRRAERLAQSGVSGCPGSMPHRNVRRCAAESPHGRWRGSA